MGARLVKEVVFPSYHVVLLVLDDSGKTTILYRLNYQMLSKYRPTVGFNCEKVGQDAKDFEFENVNWVIYLIFFQIFKKGKNYNIWDVGGKEKTR